MLDANRHKMESSCFWETVNKIVITFFFPIPLFINLSMRKTNPIVREKLI